ncbi:helix-turn-helix domain-containing protein [Streptomyces sp. NBC_00487]|uniref:helix-turn-helix domain-containing protein n=1 Tax=unclassified Streptomyces TaxID=2593676 RepID=UPI002E19FEF9|nr:MULTISPECIES: helix-turn-helix domain-containing protein [unclassified Streptomyces]
MLHESVFRSVDLPVDARFEAWAELLRQTHAPMGLVPLPQSRPGPADDYYAHQRLIPLGDVTIWPATFDPIVFRRTPKMIRQSDPETFHLSLLLQGEGAATWGRQQVAYEAQDFHVNCTSMAYEILTGTDPVTTVGLEIPRSLVALPARRADQVIGSRLSGREGVGALLAQFLMQLAADTAPYRPADAPRLGTVVADLITALFAHAADTEPRLTPEAHGRTLLLNIKAFIRRHLGDPDLTPTAIADVHHISRSYLHRLFQTEGLTVAAYVRDQRLRNAHRDLTDPDPVLRATPIHAIGARWGFPRAAEFSRAFRAAYGMPPGELRRTVDALPSESGPSANDSGRNSAHPGDRRRGGRPSGSPGSGQDTSGGALGRSGRSSATAAPRGAASGYAS